MHEILVIGFLLFPANEQAAEAVEPGVGALDYPAAGAVAGGAASINLFASTQNVHLIVPLRE